MDDFYFWWVSSHKSISINCRFPDGHVETLHSGDMTVEHANMLIAELKIKVAIAERNNKESNESV